MFSYLLLSDFRYLDETEIEYRCAASTSKSISGTAHIDATISS